MSRTYNAESSPIQIKIPWDKYAIRGFAGSIALHALLLLLLPYLDVKVEPRDLQSKTIPIELIDLNFGSGDGTGASKGNLTEEGASSRGKEPTNPLADAVRQTGAKGPTSAAADLSQSNKIVPKKDIPAETKNSDLLADASGTNSVGKKTGDEAGFGLGERGTGKGSGLGFGDIEWGGGGNRSVIDKVLPKYPPGVQPAQIRIRFTVLPDGTVGRMFPMQKGEPALEQAAMDALRRWRFNKISSEADMAGVITFTFKLN